MKLFSTLKQSTATAFFLNHQMHHLQMIWKRVIVRKNTVLNFLMTWLIEKQASRKQSQSVQLKQNCLQYSWLLTSKCDEIVFLKLLLFKHHLHTLNATIDKRFESLRFSKLSLTSNCVMLIYIVIDCVRRFKMKLLTSNEFSTSTFSQMN